MHGTMGNGGFSIVGCWKKRARGGGGVWQAGAARRAAPAAKQKSGGPGRRSFRALCARRRPPRGRWDFPQSKGTIR